MALRQCECNPLLHKDLFIHRKVPISDSSLNSYSCVLSPWVSYIAFSDNGEREVQ